MRLLIFGETAMGRETVGCAINLKAEEIAWYEPGAQTQGFTTGKLSVRLLGRGLGL